MKNVRYEENDKSLLFLLFQLENGKKKMIEKQRGKKVRKKHASKHANSHRRREEIRRKKEAS